MTSKASIKIINLQKDDDILYSDQLLHEKLKQMKQTRKQHVSHCYI